jgi:hypothetical protein
LQSVTFDKDQNALRGKTIIFIVTSISIPIPIPTRLQNDEIELWHFFHAWCLEPSSVARRIQKS